MIRLVDCMGDDLSVVRAARVSYGAETKGPKKDRRLIHFLAREGHWGPFEHVTFTFHVKAPLFVARQWMRHRTASINEISGRYVELPEECYVPDDDDGTIEMACKEAFSAYHALLARGVPREQARIVLPLATYTQFYWTCDLRNVLHFIGLRTDEHAQSEIRDYAVEMLRIIRQHVPWCVEAWEATRAAL